MIFPVSILQLNNSPVPWNTIINISESIYQCIKYINCTQVYNWCPNNASNTSTAHKFIIDVQKPKMFIARPRPAVYLCSHDDVIKRRHFPRYWPFVRGFHRSPVNCPHKGQWRGALMFSLICAWINAWVNNREAGDLRRHRPHHDVIVMSVPLDYRQPSSKMNIQHHNPSLSLEVINL